MLTIYYGEASGKSRLCTGAAVSATIREKNVLYVTFRADGDQSGRSPLSLSQRITELSLSDRTDPGEDGAPKTRSAREFFDNAVRMALTLPYGMLILEDVFDAVADGLLPHAEVYDFLSNAPDSVEVICTGAQADEKFLRLADHAVKMEPVKTDKEEN